MKYIALIIISFALGATLVSTLQTKPQNKSTSQHNTVMVLIAEGVLYTALPDDRLVARLSFSTNLLVITNMYIKAP